MVALELAGRCERTADEDARLAGQRIRAAGASRPIRPSEAEQEALVGVIDTWELEAMTVRLLRERLA